MIDLSELMKNPHVSTIGGISVVTDHPSYTGTDQVFPLHPENEFFLDEMDVKEGSRVLEIGTGSGILAIAAAKQGADVTTLEVNPRAMAVAHYNVRENGVQDRVNIRAGQELEQRVSNIFGREVGVYAPVSGEQYDMIISNPPFEPAPVDVDYFTHSAAGPYGLNFTEMILKGLDKHLTENGRAQIVTFATGDEQTPYMLTLLAEETLSGTTEIVQAPNPIEYGTFVQRLVDLGVASQQQVEEMKQTVEGMGVTHLHMCMLHYQKGERRLTARPSEKSYQNWDLPLGSDVPMGY